VLFCIRLSNFVQIGPPAAQWWRHIHFKDGGRGGCILLLILIWWCNSHSKVKIYPQTTFRRGILIHGWDITTSGLEKQTSTTLKFLFLLLLRWYHSNRRAIPHQATKFRPNQATRGGVMTSYTISRWRLRRLHTTSVSYLMTSISSEGQRLSATKFHWHLNPRLRYNYFQFGKNNRRFRFWPYHCTWHVPRH